MKHRGKGRESGGVMRALVDVRTLNFTNPAWSRKTVEGYRADLRNGKKLPVLRLQRLLDGSLLILDGAHRATAARREKKFMQRAVVLVAASRRAKAHTRRLK